MKSKKLEEMSRDELLYELLADNLNASDPNKIWNTTLNAKSGKYVSTLGKKKLTPSQASNYKVEAHAILKTDLWKSVSETLKYDAQYRMFIASDNLEKIFAGKMLLYALDVIEKILQSAANPEETIEGTAKKAAYLPRVK